ncbi:MAG TPA: hypothetical protein GX509_00025 [Firmicutes bacterium]|nr:hypothetical protein [Bacillota bacterium]
MLEILKKWGIWLLVLLTVSGIIFAVVRGYQYERALREALEAKQRADEALSAISNLEKQLQHIIEETKRLDEEQAKLDARVRERDKRLQELERMIVK